MGKNTRTVTIETKDDVQKHQQALAVEDYMQSLRPEGAKFYVYRVVGGRQRYIAMHEGVLTEDDLLSQYGPGAYLIRPKIAGQWRGSQTYEVEGPPQQNGGANHTERMPSDYSERLLLQQQEHANRLHELILALIAKGGGNDGSAMLAAITTAMANINSMTAPKGDVFDQLDKAASLIDKIGGRGDSHSSSDPLIDAALKILPQMFMQRSLPPANVNPPAVETKSESEPKRELSEPEKEYMGVLKFVQSLKEKAKQGKDPEFWADYIEENSEEAGPKAVLFAIHNGYTFDQIMDELAKLDPEVKSEPALGFLKQLYSLLKQAPNGGLKNGAGI